MCAFCEFNSQQIVILETSYQNTQKVYIQISDYVKMNQNQGINALKFASQTLLVATCQEQVFLIPLIRKGSRPSTTLISKICLTSKATKACAKNQKSSYASSLTAHFSVFNGVYELLACNSRVIALSSRRSNHVYIIDIKSQTITQSIQFPHTVQCLDLSAEDKLAVGFGK